MSVDWYETAIGEVARTAHGVCDALQAWDGDLAEARRQGAGGVPFLEMLHRGIAGGSRERRLAADEAIAAYRNAVMQLRAAVVHGLVDGEDMTITAAAGLLKISRQMASRLYGSTQMPARGPEEGRGHGRNLG